MYRAKNGDAFLLAISAPKKILTLIDGGYASTFKNHISQDLTSLASQGYELDLVVATHIDADHITGLIEFFKDNGTSNFPEIIPVKNVWHNSLRSISSENSRADTSSSDLELLKDIGYHGYPHSQECSPEEISARQGSSLAAHLLEGGYHWNNSDGFTSINSQNTAPLQLSDTVKIEAINPGSERLGSLKTWWLREVRKLGFAGSIENNRIFDDAFEFMCARGQLSEDYGPDQISISSSRTLDEDYEKDISITNSSSIAFIVHIHSTKILFLGDAWSEDIEKELRIKNKGKNSMIFDAIKISHHGSRHNTSVSLLNMIDSPAYFISTDGKRHSHPNISVLKAIVDRPSSFKRNLYFSYSTRASKYMNDYKSKSGAAFTIHENANDWISLGKRK